MNIDKSFPERNLYYKVLRIVAVLIFTGSAVNC